MGSLFVLVWDDSIQESGGLQGEFGRYQTDTIADTVDVRIDSDIIWPVQDVSDDFRCLFTYSWEFDELGDGGGDRVFLFDKSPQFPFHKGVIH